MTVWRSSDLTPHPLDSYEPRYAEPNPIIQFEASQKRDPDYVGRHRDLGIGVSLARLQDGLDEVPTADDDGSDNCTCSRSSCDPGAPCEAWWSE